MTTWRYRAVSGTGGAPLAGRMAAESAAEVRAALRRAGMRPVRVEVVRRRAAPAWAPFGEAVARWGRARRASTKADMFESIATMLDAGVSISEALETLIAVRAMDARGGRGLGRPARTELLDRLREWIRGGGALAEGMEAEPLWFDRAEVAMVRAGEHRGEIGLVLRSLAERHARSGEIGARVAAALAYPGIVGVVGLGVVVFLSTHTLPQLVAVLREARVAVPPLTLCVMAVGRGIAGGWVWVIPGLGAAAAVWAMVRRMLRGREVWRRVSGLAPRAFREAALATACLDLSDLLRVGVPLTEALRVAAPSLGRGLGWGLASELEVCAARVESGEGFVETLVDGRWFDAEVVRLVGVGESAGELHAVLAQIGQARRRRARRRADRLAAMLEPIVIIGLAVLVGLVVMAAVLPMLRLQEVI